MRFNINVIQVSNPELRTFVLQLEEAHHFIFQ